MGHMQICTLPQTDNQAGTPPPLTGRMLFLVPNQQCQSTEGNHSTKINHFWAKNTGEFMQSTKWMEAQHQVAANPQNQNQLHNIN